ncbi:MAG TPA: peptidoglycan bridge formation glycyltransferase FemA/FemB family protein [Candidatus Limnocylindrales bacterium]|nr:peptidoglycan bridge formation glycyltransferase FemA/FemB family protein [Candidatus Limnocylindrales bacterium]
MTAATDRDSRPPDTDPPGEAGADAPDSAGAGGAGPDTADAAWDRFVADGRPGSYLQLSGWARVKAVNGWRATRTLTSSGAAAPVGAQILLRRPRPLPWAFAYAPRGPVTATWTPDTIGAFTAAVRDGLAERVGRVSHLRIDPEIEADGPVDADGAIRRSLRDAGWRPATPIQPNATRIIDLTPDEDALWGDLRKKWRQYVNKARNAGITVTDAEGDALPEFYRIYRETADRAGFLIRTEQAYRDVWEAYRPSGNARLLFARRPDGEALATLFLVRSGPRVVEPYGGMTVDGGESRANYLLKWEAIRTSREQGATSYDLWGLATGGIAHFKTGFGGREHHYIGAWDLVLDPLGRHAYERAQQARVWIARRRRGLATGGSAAGFGGSDAA